MYNGFIIRFRCIKFLLKRLTAGKVCDIIDVKQYSFNKKKEVFNFLENITIIDSPCGSGKTTWAINYIKKHPAKKEKIIYITPFLSECERIIAECSVKKFVQPSKARGRGKKTTDFLNLIDEGRNIVSTHSLFTNLDKDIVDILKDKGYTLFIDESIAVIDGLDIYSENDAIESTKEDILNLAKSNIITIDECGLVKWVDDSVTLGKYRNIKNLSRDENLFFASNEFLIWTFPKVIFTAGIFKEIYLLTYRFESQLQKYYFDYFNIPYVKKTVGIRGAIVDCEKNYDVAFRKKIRSLIEICENEKLNAVGSLYRDKANRHRATAFSLHWTDTNPEALKQLNKNMQNYYKNITDSSGKERMWTTFKQFKSKLKSQTCSEKNFVNIAARATNDYADRKYLCYTINRYMNPFLVNFFSKRGIKVSQDEYALSEMIQWIWRSAIRNDEKIYIYIPSERMRNLLKNWLDIKE